MEETAVRPEFTACFGVECEPGLEEFLHSVCCVARIFCALRNQSIMAPDDHRNVFALTDFIGFILDCPGIAKVVSDLSRPASGLFQLDFCGAAEAVADTH